MARAAPFVVVLALTTFITIAQTKSVADEDNDDSNKCYDELGCFPMGEPWSSLLRPLPPPQTPTEINTRIYCYTREESSEKQYNMTLWPRISLNGLPFNAERPTVFITHGFFSNGNETWMDDLKDAYIMQVDVNVCKVDWGEGADTINYLQVASNTRIVGAEVARFVRFLQSEYGLKASSLHLIGHSLGSHVQGYVAKNVTGVYRITGLDVAQPGFEGYNETVRLDKNDAEFVDAIHTNGASFFPSRGLGCINPIGDLDIYMNDGRSQPGCALVNVMSSALSLLSGLSDLAGTAASALVEWSGCSHGRSYVYFTAALQNNCSIWGQASKMRTFKIFGNTKITTEVEECTASTCVPLGLYTPEFPARGVFTANTPEEKPFCWTAEDNNAVVERLLSTADDDNLSDKLVNIIKGFLR